jgi:hypothetical protein
MGAGFPWFGFVGANIFHENLPPVKPFVKVLASTQFFVTRLRTIPLIDLNNQPVGKQQYVYLT